MVNEGDCVAIFHSIHRVMKAEEALLREPLDILLIPVPRQLSADCGMAIRFPRTVLPEVRTALGKVNLKIAETWLKEGHEFKRLD